MAIGYLRSGEESKVSIAAKKKKPTSDRKTGDLVVSNHRVVYSGGANREIVDISPDAIESMEYTKESLWNQFTAGGVLMFFVTFVTQALFGFLASAFEGFTQFGWLAAIPLLMMLTGVVLLLYGVLARKKVLKLRTGSTVFEFQSKSDPQRMMHAIRSIR